MTHSNKNLDSYDNYGDIRIEENGEKLFWVKKLTDTINKIDILLIKDLLIKSRCLDPRNEFVIMESSRKRTNVNRRKKQ